MADMPTDDRKKLLLEAFTQFDKVGDALAYAEVSESTYRHWRNTDPGFSRAATIARREALDEAGTDDTSDAPVDPTQPDAQAEMEQRFQAVMQGIPRLEAHINEVLPLVRALEARVTRLETAHEPNDPVTVALTSLRHALRYRGPFHHDVTLWARRVQRMNKGPLTDLVEALAAEEGPDAA